MKKRPSKLPGMTDARASSGRSARGRGGQLTRDPLHAPEPLTASQQEQLERMFGERYVRIQPNAGFMRRVGRRGNR